MVLPVSAFLWLFLALVAARLLRLATRPDLAAPHPARALLPLALVGAIAFFRPHETFLAGQDPGVYLNAAASFARHNALFHHDPLLAEVPAADRHVFWFGHLGYGLSKDSTLRLADPDAVVFGPRFPPAFPVLLAPLMRTGSPLPALYVVPLFALLAALALFVVARRLALHPLAPPLAALFYLATPLVVWHARAPRPEILASFLALAAAGFALEAWQTRPARAWPDLLLAAACIALAPFFHITGWFLALAAAVVMTAWLLTGRPDALVYLPVAVLGALAYLWQSLHIADHYNILIALRPLRNQPPLLLAALVAAALLAPPALNGLARRRHRRRAAAPPPLRPPAPLALPPHLILRLAAAALLLVGTLGLYFAAPPPAARTFTGYEYHYAFPTDLRLAALYLSPAALALGLLGLLRLVLARSPATLPRLALIALFLPAALLVGKLQDFFTTRYLLTGLCPLLALGLAVLAAPAPPRIAIAPTPRRRTAGTFLAAAAILALLIHGRSAWLTTVEYRGLARFLAPFAAPVRDARGFLLAEYSRVAAPLEHLFGVPTLPLDNETRLDYTPALDALATMLARRPDRPAFFLTPYPPPLSDRFTFAPVLSNRLAYARLDPPHYRRPDRPRVAHLDLHLYRVSPSPPAAAPPLPSVRWLDPGSLTLANFYPARPTRWRVPGVALMPGRTNALALAPSIAPPPGARLLLFACTANGAAPPRRADGPAVWTPLGNDWGVLELPADAAGAWPLPTVNVLASAPTTVCDAWWLAGTQAARWPLLDDTPATDLAVSATPRWAMSPARVLVPAPATDRPAYLAALVCPPDAASPHAYACKLIAARASAPMEGDGPPSPPPFAPAPLEGDGPPSPPPTTLAHWHPPPQRWSWQICPLPPLPDRPPLIWLSFDRPVPPPLSPFDRSLNVAAVAAVP